MAEEQVCIKLIPFQILLIYPDQQLDVDSAMAIPYQTVTISLGGDACEALPIIVVLGSCSQLFV